MVARLLGLADLAPALFVHFDVELLCRGLDAFPRLVAFRVADVLHLVEAGDGIAHMGRVLERLLALLGKCELLGVNGTALICVELAHRALPGRHKGFRQGPCLSRRCVTLERCWLSGKSTNWESRPFADLRSIYPKRSHS